MFCEQLRSDTFDGNTRVRLQTSSSNPATKQLLPPHNHYLPFYCRITDSPILAARSSREHTSNLLSAKLPHFSATTVGQKPSPSIAEFPFSQRSPMASHFVRERESGRAGGRVPKPRLHSSRPTFREPSKKTRGQKLNPRTEEGRASRFTLIPNLSG